jgi:hypothetical protein
MEQTMTTGPDTAKNGPGPFTRIVLAIAFAMLALNGLYGLIMG